MAQATGGRTGTIDEMFDDLSLGFFRRELWEWHDRPQHLSDISRGQGRQNFDFVLLHQFGVAPAFFGPRQLGGSNKPQGTCGQGGVVFPSQILLRLELVPALFIFAALNGAFDEIASTQQFSQELKGSS